MKVIYVRDPGVLAVVRIEHPEGVVSVVWFLDGIKTVETLELDEYIPISSDNDFSGDLDD